MSEADLVVRAFTAGHPETRRGGGPAGSSDPYAHVTVLGPFVPREEATPKLCAALWDEVGRLLPFAATFGRVERFEDGMVWLAPEEPDTFRQLTVIVHDMFPDYPPYGGEFNDVVPHLSLGRCDPEAPLESLLSPIARMLPVRTYVGHLDLIWWSPSEGIEVLGRVCGS